MFVTGFKTWHFFSYRRKLPPLHIVVARDEKYQAALKAALDSFKKEFDAAWLKLVEINGGLPNRPHPAAPLSETEETGDLIP